MSKTVTWVVIVIVIILAIILFMMNKPESDTNDGDQNTTEQINEEGDVDMNDDTIDANVDVSLNSNRVTRNVEGSSFKFAPNRIEVKKGDTVQIVFKNTAGFHDFVIDEFNVRTSQIQAGKTETVTFVADKAGSFEYYCSVGTHRQMGMVGTLVVTE